jgi:hypothetical protein
MNSCIINSCLIIKKVSAVLIKSCLFTLSFEFTFSENENTLYLKQKLNYFYTPIHEDYFS